MMNMEIDSTTCNPAYSRARDQNNNGLLMCSPENANGQAANLHLMNSSEPNLHHPHHHPHHQMNLNHNPLSHMQGQHGPAYGAHGGICPSSMHGSNPQIHLHQQDICSSGQSDLESTPSPQPDGAYKLSPSQNETIYKRETIDSDNY